MKYASFFWSAACNEICKNRLNLDNISTTSMNKRCDIPCVSIIEDVTHFGDSSGSGSDEIALT